MPRAEVEIQEAQLNLLLRRADWRFFMPNPNPQASLSLANGLLHASIKQISERLVDPRLASPGECDLAVAVNPDRGQLERVHRSLRPGGGFYSEWRVSIYGGPAGIRRRLEQAGFTQVECYWAWPFPDYGSPSFWLSLDNRHSLAYFFSTRPYESSRRQRAINSVLRRTWRLLLNARLLAPISVAAVKPPLPTSRAIPSNPDGMLEAVRGVWAENALGEPPERLSWLLLTGGQRRVSKVVAPVFAPGEQMPRFILKMNRVQVSRARLLNEANVLGILQSNGGEALGGIPRRLFTLEHNGTLAIAESTLTGQPVFTLLNRDSYREIALWVTRWLGRMAQKTRAYPRSGEVRKYIQNTLETFQAYFREFAPADLLARSRELLACLEDLPLVCEHRDCTPWNWIRSPQGETSLLDWEESELNGLPILDLTFFLTYLALFFEKTIDEGDFRKTYHDSLDAGTFTGAIHAECFEEYLQTLGLNPGVLGPLRLFTWMLQSNLKYQRYVVANGSTPGLAWMHQAFYPSFWLTESLLASAPDGRTAGRSD